MRNILVLGLGLAFIAGCGTNVAGGVSLAQARSTCLDWDRTPDAAADFGSLVLIAEARRDDGDTQSSYLAAVSTVCEGRLGSDLSGCLACFAQVGAAVWN